jgi:hypothetical protein
MRWRIVDLHRDAHEIEAEKFTVEGDCVIFWHGDVALNEIGYPLRAVAAFSMPTSVYGINVDNPRPDDSPEKCS